MPALFAYLVAVGLLLGGGYGALSWLAAPEPVKVAGKTKPKPPPHYETNSQAAPVVSSLDANSPSLGSSNEAKPASAAPDSSAQLTLRQSGLRTTAMEQATQAPVLSQPARDQQ